MLIGFFSAGLTLALVKRRISIALTTVLRRLVSLRWLRSG